MNTASLRNRFHEKLIDHGLLGSEYVEAAKLGHRETFGQRIAQRILHRIAARNSHRNRNPTIRTAGAGFEALCAEYLQEAFSLLAHLRPGEWIVGKDGVQGGVGVAFFEQFSHLAQLEALGKSDPKLKSILGTDYLIKPDVLVARKPVSDKNLNLEQELVADDNLVAYSPLRSANNKNLILHATVSCKWTMRSDRAQNARTEALNLMKNRKGRVPHISVITGEPTPGRIASLAYGTGEIDCVYHFALPELIEAVRCDSSDDETLNAMLEGRRLRDISDLPFDLTI